MWWVGWLNVVGWVASSLPTGKHIGLNLLLLFEMLTWW